MTCTISCVKTPQFESEKIPNLNLRKHRAPPTMYQFPCFGFNTFSQPHKTSTHSKLYQQLDLLLPAVWRSLEPTACNETRPPKQIITIVHEKKIRPSLMAIPDQAHIVPHNFVSDPTPNSKSYINPPVERTPHNSQLPSTTP